MPFLMPNIGVQESADGNTTHRGSQGANLEPAKTVAQPPMCNPEEEPPTTEEQEENDDFHPGWRLRVIIVGLGVTLLLTALENTVVTVAMPVIISDLGMGSDYIWITNAFFICRCV